MGAINEEERALAQWRTEHEERAIPMPVEPTSLRPRKSRVPPWARSRRFVALVIAIAGMQLMVAMDGPIAVFALPVIQNELGLSAAGRSWVIIAYPLTFGGLMLLGGRLGDTFGRKRIYIVGVALFTIASAICGIAWNMGSLVGARLLHGAAAAIITPTCLALLSTTLPKGPARNAAASVFGATSGIGAVIGLVVGGALTDVSWRLAFLVNVPIGLTVILLARTALEETQKERMKLDVTGAVLATLVSTATVFGLLTGPENGWYSTTTIAAGLVALAAFVAFAMVERTAENPIVPFSLFFDRNLLATFAAVFLAGGVAFALTVLVALYVQTVLGYSPLRAGVSFVPFAIAVAIGMAAASKLVVWFSPRVLVVSAASMVLSAMLYGSTIDRGVPYFPDLILPLLIGAVGLGLFNVPLALSLVASVGSDRIGPTSAITGMLLNLGGPVVLAAIQAVITWRTLHLGGTSAPGKAMTSAQLDALDHGFTYGLLWLGGVVVLLGVVALFIRYTAQQVAHAQDIGKDR